MSLLPQYFQPSVENKSWSLVKNNELLKLMADIETEAQLVALYKDAHAKGVESCLEFVNGPKTPIRDFANAAATKDMKERIALLSPLQGHAYDLIEEIRAITRPVLGDDCDAELFLVRGQPVKQAQLIKHHISKSGIHLWIYNQDIVHFVTPKYFSIRTSELKIGDDYSTATYKNTPPSVNKLPAHAPA